MDYDVLLELTTDLGYRLAMNGAETFRVEESIRRILSAYGLESEVFAIPNCLQSKREIRFFLQNEKITYVYETDELHRILQIYEVMYLK